jgi:hypothetical protein
VRLLVEKGETASEYFNQGGSLMDCPYGAIFAVIGDFLSARLVYTFSMEDNKREQITRLGVDFQIIIAENGNWHMRDLELLRASIGLFAEFMGGNDNFKRQLGDVFIDRTDTGDNLGLAYRDRIELSEKSQFSAWSVIHELAHVWDAKNHWKLSVALEEYTGGVTDPSLSEMIKGIPDQWDAVLDGALKAPGSYGRKPGVNAYGYFYGDQPSGANWRFNRKEDFAESVAMYCGWGRGNLLSKTAHGRIERYLLPNGTKDPIYGIVDNWSDYARYFYPQDGDYAKTRRWKFIDDLRML